MKYEYFESNDEVRESLVRYMTNHHLIFQTYPSRKDVDDVREAPALDVMQLLQQDGADVRYHDPYVSKLPWQGVELSSEELTDAVFSWADCVVILTDHSCFDYERIVDRAKAVVDARHAASGAGVTMADGDSWIVKS